MSGGNANTTISYPGHQWQMLWDNGAFDNFQLDIVGFLAVLGEGSVTANAQVSALSPLFYLPRLIPAPQALLWPTRPVSLPSTDGIVTGVTNGNVKKQVHHVAHILLGDEMPPFTVRCVKVEKAHSFQPQGRWGSWFRGQQQPKEAQREDNAILKRAGILKRETRTPAMGPPLITAKLIGPLSWVTLLGFSLSVTLFVASLTFGDGMSLVATLLLSLLSTLIGLVNKWSLKLPQRAKDAEASTSESVVIRYPNGSYLVVRCDEDVARELYFAPEEIEYNIKSPAVYRLLSLVGTLMLMLGVIALANAKLQLQFAWAGAYIIINAAHWIAAAVPAKMHWDLSCYDVEEEGISGGPKNPNFTEALFKAILVTKSIQWVKMGEAAPQTEVWAQWLHEAETIAKTVGSRPGTPVDAFWPRGEGVKGIVWDMPKEWDPKTEWNKISRNRQSDDPAASISAPAAAETR